MINAKILTLELLDIVTRHHGLTSLSLQEATALVERKLADYALKVEADLGETVTVANTVANAAAVQAETVVTTVKTKAKAAA